MKNNINNFKLFGLNFFKLLFIFHIIVVFGLLFYVGIKRNKMSNTMFNFLGLLGVFIIIYHIYRLITNGLHDKIWNYLHILVFAPLLIYLSIYKKKSNRVVYDLILMFSFSALGLNLYFYLYH